MNEEPHSAAQFTGSRDYWWNEDYLDLLARRFRLASCRRVLELGAGVGHWTEIVLRLCHPEAELLALEREPQWIKALEERFAERPRIRASRFDVTRLGDHPGGFDLVTCQTVLLHLADVESVLRQARRLLAPGGLLLLAEPDNLKNRLQVTPSSGLTPVEYGTLCALWWAYDIGREREGLGREWIAEDLPGLIAAAGFTDIAVSQNDKAWPRFAPYSDPEQIAVYGPSDTEADDAPGADTETTVRRYALAGGLDAAAFARGWTVHEALGRRSRASIAAGTLSTCGPGNMFVFGARRPEAD